MAAAWEAETISALRLPAIAEQVKSPRVRARLMVLAAFCRAHASRLLARLTNLGCKLLPAPPAGIELEADIETELRREAEAARAMAARYETTADLARQNADLSSAWVCELNRTEEQDRASELLTLASKLK